MSASTIGIVVICVVVVLGLATWLVIVALAARRPGAPARSIPSTTRCVASSKAGSMSVAGAAWPGAATHRCPRAEATRRRSRSKKPRRRPRAAADPKVQRARWTCDSDGPAVGLQGAESESRHACANMFVPALKIP